MEAINDDNSLARELQQTRINNERRGRASTATMLNHICNNVREKLYEAFREGGNGKQKTNKNHPERDPTNNDEGSLFFKLATASFDATDVSPRSLVANLSIDLDSNWT